MTRRPSSSKTHENATTIPIHKVKWSDTEDEMLIGHVAEHGTGNWSVIATGMPGRTRKQCRERWTNQLDPNLNRDIWTPQEDAILLFQQKTQGNCWSKIAELIPHRSANALKNRWCWLARHNAAEPGKGKRELASTEKEADCDEFVQVKSPEWSDALDLSGIPEWLSSDFIESAVDGWPSWNQRDCQWDKNDLFGFT
jgi:hypothetical protein